MVKILNDLGVPIAQDQPDFGKCPPTSHVSANMTAAPIAPHTAAGTLGELGTAGSLEPRTGVVPDVRLPLVKPLLALGDGQDELVDLLGVRSDLRQDLLDLRR